MRALQRRCANPEPGERPLFEEILYELDGLAE
jgi:hypothetical protein